MEFEMRLKLFDEQAGRLATMQENVAIADREYRRIQMGLMAAHRAGEIIEIGDNPDLYAAGAEYRRCVRLAETARMRLQLLAQKGVE